MQEQAYHFKVKKSKLKDKLKSQKERYKKKIDEYEKYIASIKINYAEGYLERYDEKNKGKLGDITLNGPVTIDELDPAKVNEAVEAAKKSDVAIVTVGIHEGEFQDRAMLSLPGHQEELIKAVAATHKPVVVYWLAAVQLQ